MAKFEYKGYTLVQEEGVNHHYMIFDSDGKFRLHTAYVGDLFTQKEAEAAIDDFLSIDKELEPEPQKMLAAKEPEPEPPAPFDPPDDIDRLLALAKQKGVTEERLLKKLLKKYNIKKFYDLTSEQYKDCYAGLATMPDAKMPDA